MAVPEGYREFVAEHTPALYRTAFLLCHDRERAEHLLNRTASSLLKQYKRRTSDAECAEGVRLRVYRIFLEDTAKKGYEEAPASNAGEQSGEAFIARRLAALPPADRAIAVHAVLDDCSSQKVASDLGCTTGEVRVALASFSALGSPYAEPSGEGAAPTVVMPSEGETDGTSTSARAGARPPRRRPRARPSARRPRSASPGCRATSPARRAGSTAGTPPSRLRTAAPRRHRSGPETPVPRRASPRPER